MSLLMCDAGVESRKLFSSDVNCVNVEFKYSELDFDSLKNIDCFRMGLGMLDLNFLEHALRNYVSAEDSTLDSLVPLELYLQCIDEARCMTLYHLPSGMEITRWRVIFSGNELIIAPCLITSAECTIRGGSIANEIKIDPILVCNQNGGVTRDSDSKLSEVAEGVFCTYSIDADPCSYKDVMNCRVKTSSICHFLMNSDELYFTTFEIGIIRRRTLQLPNIGKIENVSIVYPEFRYLTTHNMLCNVIQSFLPDFHINIEGGIGSEFVYNRPQWYPQNNWLDNKTGILMSVRIQFALFHWTTLYQDVWVEIPKTLNSMESRGLLTRSARSSLLMVYSNYYEIMCRSCSCGCIMNNMENSDIASNSTISSSSSSSSNSSM